MSILIISTFPYVSLSLSLSSFSYSIRHSLSLLFRIFIFLTFPKKFRIQYISLISLFNNIYCIREFTEISKYFRIRYLSLKFPCPYGYLLLIPKDQIVKLFHSGVFQYRIFYSKSNTLLHFNIVLNELFDRYVAH